MPTGVIPFWWDMLVVVRLPRDEMMVLVDRQAAAHGEAAAGAGAR